jgi:hypothetical protein
MRVIVFEIQAPRSELMPQHIHQYEWKLNVQQHVSERDGLAWAVPFSVGLPALDGF